MAFIQEIDYNIQSLPQGDDYVQPIELSQYENGRQLRLRIVGLVIPNGSSAVLSGTKPDNTVYSTTGTISGSYVTINEDIQMTAVAGEWDAKLHIINAGNEIASARITFFIDEDPVEEGSIPSDTQLDGIIAQCQEYAEEARSSAYGSPLSASSAAGMTDRTRVYVYIGSETGYTAGHWYYWNGTAWADGGVYNAVAVQTDTTLSVSGKAADAKAVGDTLNSMYTDPRNDGNIVITIGG